MLFALHIGAMIGNPYLSAPKLLSPQEIENIVQKQKYLDFTWHDPEVDFNFSYNDGELGFSLTTLTLPVGCEGYFHQFFQDDTMFFAYTMGSAKEKLSIPRACPDFGSDYYTANPRQFKHLQYPTSIILEQLIDYIKNHNIVFYTGAGLSVVSGVPSMAQLENSLYIEKNNRPNVQKIIAHSDEILRAIERFCEDSVSAQPSVGHYAIVDLSQKKQCAIFTENIDLLHQKSGILPLMVNGNLKKDRQYFQEIDAIICVGLSYDDRGLLSLYKDNNPNGLIIAINLHQPNYLGSEDLLVTGDLQEILPALASAIK